MKHFISTLLLSFFFAFCFAGNDYSVLEIAPNLRKNAHVVKRYEERHFELLDVGKAAYSYKYAITILDEQGADESEIVLYYNKFREIRRLDGSLYDAFGKKIRSLKKSEVSDLAGSNDESLVDDTRYKRHNFYHKVYPYTVEYEVELSYNGTLFFPSWYPIESQYYSVQESNFTVVCPADYRLRFKSFSISTEPVITTKGNRKTYSWQVKNLEPILGEYSSGPAWHYYPHLLIGPSDFKIENYKGNMESWQDFGRFVYALKQGKDQLPENVRSAVHQLSDNVQDPKEKVRKLYEYMQANTRYIGIQLGIGGWQPFDASYVAANKYGDCKALSNFMYSLLKEAGIISVYALINADRTDKKFEVDFPSSQFNHVILCVPMQKDTMWLECTSQTVPAGFLGSSTCDRPALLVDEKGGNLVRTPRYLAGDNLQIRHIAAEIDNDGNMAAKVQTRYTGLQQEGPYEMIHFLTKDKVMEFLKENIDLITYDVLAFNYKPVKSSKPEVEENLDLTISHYSSASGKRLFITPNVLTRQSRKLSSDSVRKLPIVINYSYRDVDTVIIQVPAGYKVEAVPKIVSLTSSFGTYRSEVIVEGNQLKYFRSFENLSGEYPPSKYEELVSFFNQMYRADRAQVVMVKIE